MGLRFDKLTSDATLNTCARWDKILGDTKDKVRDYVEKPKNETKKNKK